MLEIVDWNNVFENAESRKVGSLRWIRMPNKHDGDSYIELLSHPRGEAHYGCWGLIVQVASKTKKRGILSRKRGQPHTPETIARAVHANPVVMREAITRLIGIGWVVDRGGDAMQLVFGTPDDSISEPDELDFGPQKTPDRGEEKRGEEKRRDTAGKKPKIVFNFTSKLWEGIKDSDVQRWQKAYPAVNVEQQILAMGEWCISNPVKGKKSNYQRFITNWLSDKQDKGGSRPNEPRNPARIPAPPGKYAHLSQPAGEGSPLPRAEPPS